MQIVREVITGSVALVGAAVAVLGYRAWHRQILGKTEHDVARSVLFASFKVREEIRRVRRPASIPISPIRSEHDDVDPDAAIDSERVDREMDLAELRGLSKLFGPRLDRLREKVVELELAVLDAEALWGDAAKATTSALQHCADELRAAVWEYLWLRGFYALDELEEEDVDRSSGRIDRNWALMWDYSARKGGSGDAFAQQVLLATAEVESFYRPKLHFRRR